MSPSVSHRHFRLDAHPVLANANSASACYILLLRYYTRFPTSDNICCPVLSRFDVKHAALEQSCLLIHSLSDVP